MADIVVRNLPDLIVRRIRAECAIKGITLREWLLPVLEAEILKLETEREEFEKP